MMVDSPLLVKSTVLNVLVMTLYYLESISHHLNLQLFLLQAGGCTARIRLWIAWFRREGIGHLGLSLWVVDSHGRKVGGLHRIDEYQNYRCSCYNDMRKENKLNEIRASLQKQARKTNLNKIFGQHRQRMLEETQKQDKEQFDRIYPTLNEDNFGDFLPFVQKFSQHPNYNFRLLPFTPCLYDYLLEHPQNRESLTILQSLSQFEEIEVPLTEELASILIKNLKLHCRTVLTILGNLLQHSRFISGLREHLMELNFVELAEQEIMVQNQQRQTIDLLLAVYFETLVIMMTSHPVVEPSIFKYLVERISKYIKRQDEDLTCILLDRLETLASSLLEDQTRARTILDAFGGLMLKEYFSYEWEVVGILLYCIKSKVAIDKQFHPLLAKSLTSPQTHLKDKVILIFDLVQQKKDLSHLVHGFPNFMTDLIRTFHCSQPWTKIKIMGLLGKLVPRYLGEEEEEMVEEYGHIDVLLELCGVVKEGLEGDSVQLKERGIDLLFGLISTLEETSEELEGVFARLQQEGVLEVIGKLDCPSEETKEKLEYIFVKVDRLQSSLPSV